jgi:Zn-dependent protease
MSNQVTVWIYQASIWALPALLAITLHEAAHGWVAWKLGDDTAYQEGRVTFNPLRHVDPVGTVFLPALLLLTRAPFLFGWAKPVPVNFFRLRNPRRDMVLVAAAGPGINLALAYACALAGHGLRYLPDGVDRWTADNLSNGIVLNLVLAVFNMIPLPPLDGGRVAVGLLPRELGFPLARLEPFGMPILIGLMFILPLLGHQLGMNLNFFGEIIGPAVGFLYDWVVVLAGHDQ